MCEARSGFCTTAQNLNEASSDAVAGVRIMSALQIRDDILQWVAACRGVATDEEEDLVATVTELVCNAILGARLDDAG
jgi:NifU-like protein involved in Fe-S cluster formation